MKHRVEDTSHDLVTSDGYIQSLKKISPKSLEAIVIIESISPYFVGYEIEKELIFFNGKSSLAQLGITITLLELELSKEMLQAHVKVQIDAIGPIAESFLDLLSPGAYVGKLFAKDQRRRVRNPDYLTRMFGRSDRWGKPLLSLGALHGSDTLIMDTIDGRAVAYLSLLNGKIGYEPSIMGFLPTLAKALKTTLSTRELLLLHQKWIPYAPKTVSEGDFLLVKTAPLHIRTVFAHVVDELLTPGFKHTSASFLQPDTQASGDIYEFYGDSKQEINDVPLEFYTLEPFREYVFFSDRDQFQSTLENPKNLFKAFETAPKPDHIKAATFIVKKRLFEHLQPEDWIAHEPTVHEIPGVGHEARQAMLVERYLTEQPAFSFLKAIEAGTITSQGIMLTRHLPSPLMKRLLLSDQVLHCIKALYFLHPSSSHGDFFTNEDRALLNDLFKAGLSCFWVDERSKKVLQYIQKPGRETGLFVAPKDIDTYLRSTVFGVYGSNIIVGPFEHELQELLSGLLTMREEMNHPLMNKETPLALVTGGGPGAMEVANRLAKELGILSCANIADFRLKSGSEVGEQEQNPYVEAKMTYRLKELVERQAEFNLDFPIFVKGGIGTDFEFCLEEVRRKVGSTPATPVLLFGDESYWKSKITSRYLCNLENGTIKGSEWVSSCFFVIQTAKQGLEIYRRFFQGTLTIGKRAGGQPLGFVSEVP